MRGSVAASTPATWTRPAWTRWATVSARAWSRPRDGGDPERPTPRRAGRAAGQQLLQQSGGAHLVTALVMRLDLTDGHLKIGSAGHPQSWRVREGQAELLELDVQLPAGTFNSAAPHGSGVVRGCWEEDADHADGCE